MKYPILHYRAGNAYLDHLETIDENARLDEFYTSKRLHKEVKERTDMVCRTIVNQFCLELENVDHEDIACYEAYLLRFLLKLERFVSREVQCLNKLHDFDNTKPVRGIAPPREPRAPEAYTAFGEMVQDLGRLERIVFFLEKKLKLWMYFLYKRGTIPDEYKTEQWKRGVCAVNPDGCYDWPRQLEDVYLTLEWVIEDEMECDILKFKDDSEFGEN